MLTIFMWILILSIFAHHVEAWNKQLNWTLSANNTNIAYYSKHSQEAEDESTLLADSRPFLELVEIKNQTTRPSSTFYYNYVDRPPVLKPKDGRRAIPSLSDDYIFPGTILDWRHYGVMTAVKNQNHCNACWVYAAVAVIEGRLNAHGRQVPQLSEKQVMTCTRRVCTDGHILDVVHFAKKYGGIDTLAGFPNFPQPGETPRCSGDSPYKIKFKIVDAIWVSENGTSSIINALQTGPVFAGMRAEPSLFSFKTGVYANETCLGPDGNYTLNHAVAIVGFGVDPVTGEDFWICKNSWGTLWGVGGYFMIKRGVNTCDMENHAWVPVFSSH